MLSVKNCEDAKLWCVSDAALDAYVMVEIWEAVRADVGPTADEMLDKCCIDISRARASAGSSSRSTAPEPVRSFTLVSQA